MATNTNCVAAVQPTKPSADDGQRALDKRQQQRKDQREITEFWNHDQGIGLGMRKGLQGRDSSWERFA